MTELETEVATLVAQVVRVPPEEIRPETDLRVAYNVDSLQALQIVALVERRFEVTVPLEEVDDYSSVGAIARFLASADTDAAEETT